MLHTAEDRAPYAGDMGHHAHASPDLVVLPLTTEETAAVVRLCYKHRIPVVTRGAGTGLEAGSSIPHIFKAMNNLCYRPSTVNTTPIPQ